MKGIPNSLISQLLLIVCVGGDEVKRQQIPGVTKGRGHRSLRQQLRQLACESLRRGKLSLTNYEGEINQDGENSTESTGILTKGRAPLSHQTVQRQLELLQWASMMLWGGQTP